MQIQLIPISAKEEESIRKKRKEWDGKTLYTVLFFDGEREIGSCTTTEHAMLKDLIIKYKDALFDEKLKRARLVENI